MSSDHITPRPASAFRFAGPGSTWTMRCGACGKQMPNLGRRQVKRGGIKIMVGKCCAPPPKPENT